jgi:hypothetical protein
VSYYAMKYAQNLMSNVLRSCGFGLQAHNASFVNPQGGEKSQNPHTKSQSLIHILMRI